MKFCLMIGTKKLYEKDTIIVSNLNDSDDPDLELLRIIPGEKAVVVRTLTDKFAAAGQQIYLPINLLGSDAYIREDIGDDNPNSMFKALRNNTREE